MGGADYPLIRVFDSGTAMEYGDSFISPEEIDPSQKYYRGVYQKK